jgi:hypothetical protein
MGRGRWLAALALTVACGARTPLLTGDDGGAGGGGGGGTGPLAVPCGAALLAGAPTPIEGYCSTRANQALLSGPSAPAVAWSTVPFAIPDPENYLPATIVVDATGRAYFAVNASPMNMAGGPNRVAAVDPDGTVAWIQFFPAQVTGLALGSDGTLWMLEGSSPTAATPGPNFLVGLAPDGTNRVSIDLSASNDSGILDDYGAYDQLAIGFDGTFFLGSSQGGGVEHLAVAGGVPETLWTSGSMGFNQQGPTPPVMLTPDDRAIALGGEGLYELDASGQQLWDNDDVDWLASGVDASGQIVGVGTTGGDGPPFTQTIDGAGQTVSMLSLASAQSQVDAADIALAGDGTTVVLLADEASSPGTTKTHVQIVAIDPSGSTRWTTTLDESLPFDPAATATHYGLFVDSDGTVIVTAGVVTGIALSSGSVLWTVKPASPASCLRPAVLGTGGSILASQCDGTVFLARDP